MPAATNPWCQEKTWISESKTALGPWQGRHVLLTEVSEPKTPEELWHRQCNQWHSRADTQSSGATRRICINREIWVAPSWLCWPSTRCPTSGRSAFGLMATALIWPRGQDTLWGAIRKKAVCSEEKATGMSARIWTRRAFYTPPDSLGTALCQIFLHQLSEKESKPVGSIKRRHSLWKWDSLKWCWIVWCRDWTFQTWGSFWKARRNLNLLQMRQ